MGRIGASLSSIERSLLHRLAQAHAEIDRANLRLSTGRQINRPADSPSTFLQLDRLRRDLAGVNQAAANVTAASTIVAGAQSTLDQIAEQLDTIRTLALDDQLGDLSSEERAAHQAAIDTAVEAIRSLSRTEAGGRRPLDGSADYFYDGLNRSQIRALQVFDRGPDTAPTISGQVTTAATQATLTLAAGSPTVTGDATVTLGGLRGEITFDVNNGEALTAVRDRINQQSNLSGVTATVQGGTNLVFTTVDYGSRTNLTLTITDGSGTVTGTDSGSDAIATINGRAFTGDGNRFSVGDNGLRLTLEFAGGFNGSFSTVTVRGEALSFALTPEVSQRRVLALAGVQPELLGGISGSLQDLVSGGTYGGLGTNTPRAVRIADEALAQIQALQGQLAGFASAVIDSSDALYAAQQDNLDDAIEQTDGYDEQTETARLSYFDALASNALAGLAILQDQRADVVLLIQKLAGLS